MNSLSLGLRLVIVLPTTFFLVSQILRYGLKIRSKKEAMGRNILESRWIFSWVGEQSTREFRWEFFIDSAILSMANGLILIFELARVEYGVILLILGIIVSLAGLVATESNSNSAIGLLVFCLIVLFICEMSYFLVYGIGFRLFGFTLLPWHVFFLPSVVVLILVFLAGVASSRKKIQKK